MNRIEISILNRKLMVEFKKYCSSCNSIKDLNEFTINSSKQSGRSSTCRKCRAIKRSQNRAKDNSKFLEYERDPIRLDKQKNCRFIRNYGITLEKYENLVDEQQNLCKICLKNTKLVIDHCHRTGKVRGLLCHNCNVSLGLLKENIKIIQNIINYLKEFK